MHEILMKALRALKRDNSFELDELYDQRTADRIADRAQLIEMADKRKPLNSMTDMLSLYNRTRLSANEAEWIMAWTCAYHEIRTGIIENMMREMPLPPHPTLGEGNHETMDMEVA